jgi:methylated-DNA-[protein]-cysteine S-methyltransferase
MVKFATTLERCSWISPLGSMTLASSATHIAGIWFDGQSHQPPFHAWQSNPQHPLLLKACEQLAQYFDGSRRQFELPLNLGVGTPFQQRVWQSLLTVASAQTVTYGELSHRLGQPRAVRAVGAAIGRNPFTIVVPCHRVVGIKGALTGYAGGLARKAALLASERAANA